MQQNTCKKLLHWLPVAKFTAFKINLIQDSFYVAKFKIVKYGNSFQVHPGTQNFQK